jgi:phosphoadenosine phosphosulfate reductase
MPATEATLKARTEKTRALLDMAQSAHMPVVFANSFGAEDMVLTDMIARSYPGIGMFTLDTGRLPEETYRLMEKVADRYGIRIPAYFPDASAVEAYVAKHGPNAFYDDVDLRKTCCHIRKVEPLKRALQGKRAWITGLRRDQAPTRKSVTDSQFDVDNGLQKISPLLDWSLDEVWDYLKQFDVPYNVLHDKGYTSIGCAPCTRAITVGEDVRAGRWWWENPEIRECGLHPAGKGDETMRASPTGMESVAAPGKSADANERDRDRPAKSGIS